MKFTSRDAIFCASQATLLAITIPQLPESAVMFGVNIFMWILFYGFDGPSENRPCSGLPPEEAPPPSLHSEETAILPEEEMKTLVDSTRPPPPDKSMGSVDPPPPSKIPQDSVYCQVGESDE